MPVLFCKSMISDNRRHRILLVAASSLLLLAGIFLLLQSIRGFSKSTVIVEWSTASELDTVGFNLYRAESKEGSYEKINVDLIPASTDPLTGGSYKYEDKSVRAGTVYYYQLEDIESSGLTQKFGPIEVKASGSGLVEVVLASILTIAGLISFVLTLRQNKQSHLVEAADVS